MLRIILIFIIFLNLKSLTNADDITDFEIEGMSLKDSLLNFMSSKQINEALESEYAYFYEDKFVTISTWDIKDKYEIYDNVGVVLKQNDLSYTIYGLEGLLITHDGIIENCYKKQEIIANDILEITGDKYSLNSWFLEKNRRKKHQLNVKYIDFISTNNSKRPISIVCMDINRDGDKYTRLVVAIDSDEFDKYLDTVF